MKLRGGETQMVPVLAKMGLPDARVLAFLIGACELLGGVAVCIGYPVLMVCSLLGVWCLLTGYMSHKVISISYWRTWDWPVAPSCSLPWDRARYHCSAGPRQASLRTCAEITQHPFTMELDYVRQDNCP